MFCSLDQRSVDLRYWFLADDMILEAASSSLGSQLLEIQSHWESLGHSKGSHPWSVLSVPQSHWELPGHPKDSHSCSCPSVLSVPQSHWDFPGFPKDLPFLLAFAGFSLGVYSLVPRPSPSIPSFSLRSCKRRETGRGPGNEFKRLHLAVCSHCKLSDVSRMREATCF